MTVDETCIHHRALDIHEQSAQWAQAGSFAQKIAKVFSSAAKDMATVFWDSERIIFINSLVKGKYYAKLSGQLDIEIKKNTLRLAEKTVLFHRNNATVHTSMKALAKIDKLCYVSFIHILQI